jgi:ABC-type lipoprotein export system ATPase subunit
MKLLKELHKEWRTIIMVTHAKDVAEYADKIIYLEDGKIME